MKHFVGEQFRVSQNFLQEDDFTRKTYKSGVHFGTDFATPVGTPLYSPCEGKIADVVLNHASLGNCIFFENGSHVIRFLHLSKVFVKKVTQSQRVRLLHRLVTQGWDT